MRKMGYMIGIKVNDICLLDTFHDFSEVYHIFCFFNFRIIINRKFNNLFYISVHIMKGDSTLVSEVNCEICFGSDGDLAGKPCGCDSNEHKVHK